ncbi:uncharacterized protein LOC143616900 [Bidens hawaiensis]|uniref:uncharacterized protein LOC143616900 n=1 Tax=Bidens hawaiensis TaxID=980011 RepID=UPI00404B28E3
MALFLQETAETERGKNRSTIVDFLAVRTMDGGGRSLSRRKSLHERLGLKSIVCCGSIWGFGASAMKAEPNDDEDENDVNVDSVRQQIDAADTNDEPECTLPSPRMNLADALAAERQFRSTSGTGDDTQPPLSTTETTEEVGTPLRISLMRLLEETEKETDGQDEDDEKEELGRDEMCCVCMGRKKGAALIPCGHTYCRTTYAPTQNDDQPENSNV